ncbi:MAG: hypothetical protein ACXVYY_01230 [Oryzihumus sp.]
MNGANRITTHPLLGAQRVYRAHLPAYDPASDDEPGILVVGNGMAVTVVAAFHDWNGVQGLDVLYVRCHETGLSTHVVPTDVGWDQPLI